MGKIGLRSLFQMFCMVGVKLDIKDAKYLKLRADDNSTAWWAAWYDEAVYADAKLIKESHVEDTSKIDFIKTKGEYDKIQKQR